MHRTRVLIMGAAGRDFHNFNTYFRGNDDYEVVAFTATQIPGIEGRNYPPELAGDLYPNGIPIHDESELDTLIRENEIEQVIFAYSDVPHAYVMHKGIAGHCRWRRLSLDGVEYHTITIEQTNSFDWRSSHRRRKEPGQRDTWQ